MAAEKRLFTVENAHFSFRYMRDRRTPEGAFSTHMHDVPELIYMPEVYGRQIIEDTAYALHAHDLVLMPPAVHHAIEFDRAGYYERYVLLFDPCILDRIDLQSIYQHVTVINGGEHPILPDIFRRIDYYEKNLDADAFEDILTLLIKEIFYNLGLYENVYTDGLSSRNPILSKAIAYIRANLFTIRSISEISDSLFITESYLYEIFKNTLHISPKKYITAKRLLTAKRELDLGAAPTQIYQKTGFSSYAAFYRSYTAFFGHAPSKEKFETFSGRKY